MLTPQIKTQVEAVLRARQLEDKAYSVVMKITSDTPLEEADRAAKEYERLLRVTARTERTLANMVIQESAKVVTR